MLLGVILITKNSATDFHRQKWIIYFLFTNLLVWYGGRGGGLGCLKTFAGDTSHSSSLVVIYLAETRLWTTLRWWTILGLWTIARKLTTHYREQQESVPSDVDGLCSISSFVFKTFRSQIYPSWILLQMRNISSIENSNASVNEYPKCWITKVLFKCINYQIQIQSTVLCWNWMSNVANSAFLQTLF